MIRQTFFRQTDLLAVSPKLYSLANFRHSFVVNSILHVRILAIGPSFLTPLQYTMIII